MTAPRISVTLKEEGIHFFLENAVLFTKEEDSPYLLFGGTKVHIARSTAESLQYLMENPPYTTNVRL